MRSEQRHLIVLSTDPAVVRDLASFVAEFIREEIDELHELSAATILDAFGCWGVPGSSQAFMDSVTGNDA